jgi:hypothetical protein
MADPFRLAVGSPLILPGLRRPRLGASALSRCDARGWHVWGFRVHSPHRDRPAHPARDALFAGI